MTLYFGQKWSRQNKPFSAPSFAGNRLICKQGPIGFFKRVCWCCHLFFCFTGQTQFIPAFRKAFELLKSSVSKNSGESRQRVILFLTDGDPSDSKEDLFRIIRDRNLELNNSVIIMTYGFDRAYQEILIDIANQNTTKYGVPANTSVGDIAVM